MRIVDKVKDLNRPKWYLLFFTYLVAIQIRFSPYNFETLTGDDIILLGWSNQSNGYMSTFWPSFTDHTLGKWRPVPQVILSPLLDFFGGDFWKYQFVNEALLAVCGLLLALLVTNLTGGKFLLGVSAGSFLILARFNLYHVLQVLGLMESIAIAFMLALLICLERFARTKSVKFLYLSNVFFLLVIHTHERFFFLLPLVLFCTFIYSSGLTPSKRCVMIALPLLSIVGNYLVKTQIFNMTFLTGGGGTEINSSTTDIPSFTWRALLNIFGYNSGPDYLSGKNAHQLGHSAIYVALIWAIPLILLILLAVTKHLRTAGFRNSLTNTTIAILLLAPLLLSASITFRQEYRWLLAPYIGLIIISHAAVGVLARSRRCQMVLSAILIAAGSIVGIYYSKYAESTYFFSTQSLGDSVNDRIFVQYGDEISTTTFVIVNYDSTVFNWAVGDLFHYSEYSPETSFDIRTVPSIDQIKDLMNLRENTVVFDYQIDQVVQLIVN